MNVYEVLTIGVKNIRTDKTVDLEAGDGCLVFTDEPDKRKIDAGVKEAIAPQEEGSEIILGKGTTAIIIVKPVSLDEIAANLTSSFRRYGTMLLQDAKGIYVERLIPPSIKEALKLGRIQSLNDFTPG